jgi:hypothetical protein
MEHQKPDPTNGITPSQGPRVEDDLVRPLTPIKGFNPRRLSASLPVAVVSVLLIATVAFGAAIMSPMVLVPGPSATPVDVGDDGPDDTLPPATTAPTLEPTAAPTAVGHEDPTAAPTTTETDGSLTLTATLSVRKVVLTWTAYEGADFAYYKVVRSSDKTASWPLGEGDTLVAAISDQATLTFTDCPPAGKTWSYEVFAVKASGDGYVVLDSTNLVTIAVPAAPKPTPKPTTNCGISLSAKVLHGHVVLTWSKYHCDLFQFYVPVRSLNSHPDVPLPHEGTEPMTEIGDINQLSWTDTNVEPGHTYYYRVMVWNEKNFCNGGTVLAKSRIVKVTIPLPATAAPTEPTAGV